MTNLESTLAASLTPAPFLRWAGGKRQLVPTLLPIIQEALAARLTHSHNARSSMPIYVEPFLGAGAVALAVCSAVPRVDAVLGDYCEPLLNTWRWIKKAPTIVHQRFAEMVAQGATKEDYLGARLAFNSSRASFARAVLFLYLNHLGFNGLWRVNPRGEYNVPYGDGRRATIPSHSAFDAVQQTLAHASLHCEDAISSLRRVAKSAACLRSVIYIDPPYDDGFVDYVADGFSEEQQRALADVLRLCAQRGAAVIANNANTPFISEIYAWADRIEPISERRAIAAKGDRRQDAKCLLITANLG